MENGLVNRDYETFPLTPLMSFNHTLGQDSCKSRKSHNTMPCPEFPVGAGKRGYRL